MRTHPVGNLVRTAQEWQGQLALRDAAFARFLGRHKSEWSMLCSGARQPSPGFIRALLTKAAGTHWHAALEKAHLSDIQQVAA